MPSGTTAYEYDAYGRLILVRDPDGEETRYTYDADVLSSVMYPNGTMTEYGYDNLNRLISVETRTLTSDIVLSSSYTLNVKSQRTHVEERVGTQLVRTIDYTYDKGDRLIEEQIDDAVTGERTITYTYDPVGNRLTKNDNGVIITYIYDDNDRLLTENGYTYGYDNNGNMLSKTGNGEQYNLTYNYLNQLIHADMSTAGGSSTVDYTYDHDGIRVGKTINGTDVIKYIVDKNRPYAQVLEEQWTNGSLSAVMSYVYAGGLISRTFNGMKQYYHHDGFGSVRALSDASANVTDTYRYDAYGMLLGKTGNTDNPYLYRGEQYDPDVSSYYLRARYYQPDVGRFLMVDPIEGVIGDPLSAHRYLYGHADPVNNFDPSGQLTLKEAATTVGIISFLASASVATLSYIYEDFFADLSELFPDAGIVGFSVVGQFRAIQYGLLKSVFEETVKYMIEPGLRSVYPRPLVFEKTIQTTRFHRDPGAQPVANVSVGGGGEILFSVASAQIGGFLYGTVQAEVGVGDFDVNSSEAHFFDIPVTLYHGWVWNLWNAKDYNGWFFTVNFAGRKSGMSLFKDLIRPFAKGPYGFAFPFANFSLLKQTSYKPINTVAPSFAYYRYGSAINCTAPWKVAFWWTVAEGGVVAISMKTLNPAGLISSSIGVSWPFTIARLKSVWNKRYDYSVEKRQATPDRPPEFSTGPLQWSTFF